MYACAMLQADPSEPMTFLLRYQSIRNALSADFGPLTLSVFDAVLFSWTKVAVRYYLQAAAIDFKK